MLAFGRLANKDSLRALLSTAVQLDVDILLPLVSERCQRSNSSGAAVKESPAADWVLRHYLTACAQHPLTRSIDRDTVADGSWPLAPAKVASAIIEACEQSERVSLPLLLPAVSLSAFASAWNAGSGSCSKAAVEPASSTTSKSQGKRRSTLPSTADALQQNVLFPSLRLRGLGRFGHTLRHAVVAHEFAAEARRTALGFERTALGSEPQLPEATGRPGVLTKPSPLFSSVAAWRHAALAAPSGAQQAAGASGGAPASASPPPLPLLAIVVGPEGGWGPADEPALAFLAGSGSGSSRERHDNDSGCHSSCNRSGAFVSLGRNILRAETAALAALAVANAALE